MKISGFAVAVCMGLIAFSCTKKEDNKSTFSDKLTFGTSISYTDFKLVGEGSTFSTVPGNVAFRLESEEDFSSNPVKFVIKKDGILYSTEIKSGATGHIFMTTFSYALAGSYSVTGYIQKSSGDKTVASGSFQMQ